MNLYIRIFVVTTVASVFVLPVHPFVQCAYAEDFAMPAGSVICTGSGSIERMTSELTGQ